MRNSSRKIRIGALVLALVAGAAMLMVRGLLPNDPEWLALILAILGLSANAVVGYFDRVVETHRCLIVPLWLVFESNDIRFRALLINAGNRHVALTQVHLSIKLGPVAHSGTGATPKSVFQAPIILTPGEMRETTFEFEYFPSAVYAAPDVGEMVGDDRKRVVWHLSAMVYDSSGRFGRRFQMFPIWREDIGPDGHMSSGSLQIEALTVHDERNWLGPVGR